jgi:hypothetical protein
LFKKRADLAYEVVKIPLNPGIPMSFPWLSTIAQNYERYRFRKLSFHYMNSSTGTFSGIAVMGIDYDASDDTPLNEAQLQSYEGTVSGCVTRPLRFNARADALNRSPQHFVRIGDLSANEDVKMYDSGNFFFAMADGDTSAFGRVFVEYEIELMTPQLSDNVICQHITVVGVSAAAPIGTSLTTTGTIPVEWYSGTRFYIKQPGQYLVSILTVGTVITGAVVVSAIENSLGGSAFTELDTTIDSAATGASSLAIVTQGTIDTDSGYGYITVSKTATTITSVIIRIVRYEYALA